MLLFNASSGDISPTHPDHETLVDQDVIENDFNRLEAVGRAAVLAFELVFDDIETIAPTSVDHLTAGVPVSLEAIGYEGDEFPYPGGGLACGMGEGVCWDEEGDSPNMACIPIPVGIMNDFTLLSSLRLGELLILTLPGEPVTNLGMELIETASEQTGIADVAVFGYSQDHLGYLMQQDDFNMGGYEPTMSPWGPKFGGYVAVQVLEIARLMLGQTEALPFEPVGSQPIEEKALSPYTPMKSASTPVAESVDSSKSPLIRFSWRGGDPWLGNPTVVLQENTVDGWQDVELSPSVPLNSYWYSLVLELEMVPSWDEDKSSKIRDFVWTVEMPTIRNVPGGVFPLSGEYRFAVSGQWRTEDGSQFDYLLDSDPFEVGLRVEPARR